MTYASNANLLSPAKPVRWPWDGAAYMVSTKNKDKQTDVGSSKGVARFMTLVSKIDFKDDNYEK